MFSSETEATWKALKKKKAAHTACPVCQETAYQTEWRPKAGLDPELRQYLCLAGHLSYRIPPFRPPSGGSSN